MIFYHFRDVENTPADRWRTYEWAIDPEAVKQAFSDRSSLTREQHKAWFDWRVPQGTWWILESEDQTQRLGQIRLDRRARALIGSRLLSEVYVAGVFVAPDHRGQGFGTSLIQMACKRVELPVIARIKGDNWPSLRAFRAAGFSLHCDEEPRAEGCPVSLPDDVWMIRPTG